MRSLLALLLCLLLPASAAAMVDLSGGLGPVRGNPADTLASLPIEASVYDRATRCSKASKPGMTRLVNWLQANAKGVSWGTYRCEKWGKGSASLHAEGRALDWHLDVSRAADKREATRLIRLLLAPDKAGNAQALARRMGVEEIIWDCGYWMAGMREFKRYSPCVGKNGEWRKKVNKTVAHRDHVHFGMTKAGAAAKTSFWTRRAASEDQVAPDRGDWDRDREEAAPRPTPTPRPMTPSPQGGAAPDSSPTGYGGGAEPSSDPQPEYDGSDDETPWDDPDEGGADPYDPGWD